MNKSVGHDNEALERVRATVSDDAERAFVVALEPFLSRHGQSRQKLRWARPIVFLAEHARFWAPAALPNGVARGPSGACFANAWRVLTTKPGLRYVEGYAFDPDTPFPIEHAWCVDASGQVVDPTWPDPQSCRYYGAKIPTATVAAVLATFKTYGVLDDSRWRDTVPILERAFDERSTADTANRGEAHMGSR